MKPTTVGFGRFVFEPVSGELRQGDRTVRLQPQPAQVLAILIARAGEVVTRDELKEKVWPDSKVEFDQGLNFCISQIRGALRDRADSPVYVETLPRRGYRFIAPVTDPRGSGSTVRGADPGPERAPEDGDTGSGPSRFRRLPMSVGIALILVAGATWSWIRDTSAPVGPERVLLAVLPVDALDPARLDLSRGLAEELITELVRTAPEELGVIASTSALRYLGETIDPSATGHELGADYVLWGAMRDAPSSIRVTMRLTRVEDGEHIWADAYDHPSSDAAGLQIDVGRQVVRSVARTLAPGSTVRDPPAASLPTADRDRYLRGRHLLTILRRATVETGATLLDSVLVNNPTFVPALTGRALALGLLSRDAEARALALRAAELDPSNGQAQWILATLSWEALEWEEARRYYEQALALEPGSADIHRSYAFFHYDRGDYDRALISMERALELDPVSPIVQGDLGQIYLAAGRSSEAAEACRLMRLLSDEPDLRAEQCLFRERLAAQDLPGAAAQARVLLGLAGTPDATSVAADERLTPEETLDAYWRWRMADGESRATDDPRRYLLLAEARANLGQVDEAATALETLGKVGPRTLLAAAGDPLFRPVLELPRVQELLAELRERGPSAR